MDKTILDFIEHILSQDIPLVYVLFFVSNVLQMVFPPHPADLVLFFQGYVTTVYPEYNFFLVLLNAMLGTIAGSSFIYYLGYKKGNAVFRHKLVRRFITRKYQARAEWVFRRYGSYAIFVSKFIPGVNAIVIVISGVFKVKPKVFFAALLVSVTVHHVLILLLGRFLGGSRKQMKTLLSNYNRVALLVFAVLVLAIIGYLLYNQLTKKKGKRRKNKTNEQQQADNRP